MVALTIALSAIFFARNAYVKESQSINHQQISAIKNQEAQTEIVTVTSTQNIANVSSTNEGFVTSTQVGASLTDLKVYQNDKAGFKVEVPKSWEITNEIIKLDKDNSPTTTLEVVEIDAGHGATATTTRLISKGFLYFGLKGQGYMDSNMINSYISSFDSNLDLNVFLKRYQNQFPKDQVVTTSTNFKSFAEGLSMAPIFVPADENHHDSWNFYQSIFLKNGKQYFQIAIFAVADSKEAAELRISEYRHLLETFQPTPLVR